jgi:hypothetical protein
MEDNNAQSSTSDSTEDKRKHELRKAGKEYLERALAQANKGKDPFVAQPVVSKEERVALKRVVSTDDPDVAAFGAWFEGTLLYVLVAVYIAAQASTLVFLKGCLLSMATPATLTFLHMLPVALAVWIMGSYDMVPPPTMTAAAVKGSSAKSVLQSLQVRLHCHLYMALPL